MMMRRDCRDGGGRLIDRDGSIVVCLWLHWKEIIWLTRTLFMMFESMWLRRSFEFWCKRVITVGSTCSVRETMWFRIMQLYMIFIFFHQKCWMVLNPTLARPFVLRKPFGFGSSIIHQALIVPIVKFQTL